MRSCEGRYPAAARDFADKALFATLLCHSDRLFIFFIFLWIFVWAGTVRLCFFFLSELFRAFRKPVNESTLEKFYAFAKINLDSGQSFEETMRQIVGAVIGMPEFIYLYEKQGEASKSIGRVRASDFELASRLSQFFWSSIPDNELLRLAESGKLSQPKILSQQIDRMMNDRKMARFLLQNVTER